MITAGHVILYSRDPEADREFFQKVLDYPHVDAGGGWLIFKLPPTELGVHPAEGPGGTEFMLMCEDLVTTMAELTGKRIEFTKPVAELPWGRATAFRLPGGGELGLYEPKHPVAATL
ncbi:MAG TPA: extradiol dioxygenase [Actinospica sp.]|jgi:predicted enzyme related to lactoylglutathione lyase|nr:extradiol dioxygenase [Actinospica sp.]